MIAKRLEDDEVAKFDLGGQVGVAIIVNESGLYNVILRSDKPEAKPFRKWVTSEVLPSIRKTGSYSVNETMGQNTMVDMFRDFLQTQQQQLSLIMQGQIAQQQAQQEANNQQLTAMSALTNLITTAIPQPCKPPFTRWMGKALKKVDTIAAATGSIRRQMLHTLYNELQDAYGIDLDEYQYEFCCRHGVSNTGIYTLNTIGADLESRKLFDLMLDTYIEQYSPDTDTETPAAIA